MTYGNGDYVDYSYDNYGNVRERSQNGTVTYRAYADNTGAVTREVDESNNVEYNYLYDSTDRLVSKKASYISAASGARSFKSSFSYDYDLNNNVTKFSVLTAKGPITTDYTYGLDNLPLTATFQSGKVLTNTFDKLGRLTKTNLNTNSNIETTYTYLASGYEGDYTTNFVETETNGVFTYKYEYDANGNITKVYRKNGNTYEVSEEYTYNELNELTQVDYLNLNKRYTYSYDSGGNISKEKVYTLNNGTPTYQSSKNYVYGDFNWHDKLTSYGGSAITYDTIGNPLSYRGMTLTWQNGRQLASSSDGSTVTNYTYGADGMRMTKKVGSSTTYYQYFNGLLIQEIKGTKILDYSYDANGQVCAVRYRTNANDEGTYYYYAHNTRGDIVGLYNADGSLHAKYSYDVWGNPLSVTDASNAAITSQTDIANLQSFRYRGYYYDSNSGFYYLQSRYYDPVTHRFLNADGLVSTGTGVLGYNMFAYCENNPVNCFDLNGSMTIKQAQWRLASGKPCGYSILDITKMQKMGAKSNDVFFYDYSKTYGYGGVRYQIDSSIYKTYSPTENYSFSVSKSGYSVSKDIFLNVVSSMSGKHYNNIDTLKVGCKYGDVTIFLGENKNNHLIGWDYSVNYNNNGGSLSGTLSIDKEWYNNARDTVLVSGIVIASATVAAYLVSQIAGALSLPAAAAT